jgi:hypothetical protein
MNKLETSSQRGHSQSGSELAHGSPCAELLLCSLRRSTSCILAFSLHLSCNSSSFSVVSRDLKKLHIAEAQEEEEEEEERFAE